MEQLNKCPFCGGEVELTGNRFYRVVCMECCARIEDFETEIEAITAWNTRKPLEQIVERIHGYFVSEINALPTDEIPHDILRHNKQVCKIVKEEFLE